MQSALLAKLNNLAELIGRDIKIMEVCGTHTQSIYRYGIKDMLPANIELISGPGCPVCVTDIYDIDYLLAAASRPGVQICCYGDMLRVPGTNSSLYEVSAQYGNVHIVTSAEEVLALAEAQPEQLFVFWAVGFETTTPMTALVIKKAAEKGLQNLKVLCKHKTMPEILSVILQQENKIDALLCPGHVAVIAGSKLFKNLPLPAVISGFEEEDILSSIELLLQMLYEKDCSLINNYKRFVNAEGNVLAQQAIDEVFCKSDALWRGIGLIADSGMQIREQYEQFDAELYFGELSFESKSNELCLCGEIIKGNCSPDECKYFAKACTPDKPLGPCMVSSEGACSAAYKYGRVLKNE